MRSRFGFAWPADKCLALNARLDTAGFLAKARGSVVETLVQFSVPWISLSHIAAPLLEKAGAQLAISSPIDAESRAAMRNNRRNAHWFQPAEYLKCKDIKMSNDLVVQLGAKLDQFQSDMNQAGDMADSAVSLFAKGCWLS